MNLLQRSLSGSAIVLFALLLRGLARNRLPKRGFVALWLLAAARMLLPWKLPFRYGASALLLRAFPALRSLLPSGGASLAAEEIARGAIVPRGAATAQMGLRASDAATATGAMRGAQGFALSISPWRALWLLGLVACALTLLLPHLRWRRVYARSLPLKDERVEAWLREHPLRLRRVRARASDEVPTPLSYGLFRPVILLPETLLAGDARRLEYVLAHELAHIRNFDLISKLALAAALCAHWFNPLAWAMYLLANRDLELACDAAALRGRDLGARREYANALLDLAARRSGLPGPLSNAFGRLTIEERISAIMKTKTLSKFAALLTALAVLFAGLAFATGAEEVNVEDEKLEEMMFQGWEELPLDAYWREIYRIDPEPQLRLSEANWENARYTDYLRFVLDPLTGGEWTAEGGLLSLRWTVQAGTGAIAYGGELDGASGGFDFTVRCALPDASALTAGEFRDALRGAVGGMEDIDPLSATQAQLDDRAQALTQEFSSEAMQFEIKAQITEESGSPRAVLAALRFEGWEKLSARDYRDRIYEICPDPAALLGEDIWDDARDSEFARYVLEPLTSESWARDESYALDESYGGIDVDSGEGGDVNLRIELRVLDSDALTAGGLRDILRGAELGMEALDPVAVTQAQLDARAAELSAEFSSEVAALEILAEVVGRESPYADAEALDSLEKYAALGLEYEMRPGKLSLRYGGREVAGVLNPVAGITIANSAGPSGLDGGPIVQVVYEDGAPAALRFVEE